MSNVSFIRWSMVGILATGFEVQLKLGETFELVKTIYATSDIDYLTPVTLPEGVTDPVFKVVPFLQNGDVRTYATDNDEVYAETFGFIDTPESLVAGTTTRLPFMIPSPFTSLTVRVDKASEDFDLAIDEVDMTVLITPAESQTSGEVTVTLFIDDVIPAFVTIPLVSDPGNIEVLATVTDTDNEVFFESFGGDGGVQVDWGDGTDYAYATSSHVYAEPGVYKISIYASGLSVNTIAVYGTPIKEITRIHDPMTTKLRFCTEEGTGGESIVRVPRDVVLPSDLTGLFKGCTSLNDPNLSYWDISNVSVVDNMFQGCTSLNCDLSSWDTSGLNTRPVVDFATGSGLTEDKLPEFMTYG